jgi:hypothetical protein
MLGSSKVLYTLSLMQHDRAIRYFRKIIFRVLVVVRMHIAKADGHFEAV